MMIVLVLLLGLAGAASMVLTILLVDYAGPVFAAQGAYALTLAGIVWGMLLLDEQLSLLAWGAFIVILLGLYLVEPRSPGAAFVLRRSFSGKSKVAGANPR